MTARQDLIQSKAAAVTAMLDLLLCWNLKHLVLRVLLLSVQPDLFLFCVALISATFLLVGLDGGLRTNQIV